MVNEKKLRELILEKGFKLKYIAEKLELSPMGFRLKLTNKNDFTVNEAVFSPDFRVIVVGVIVAMSPSFP